MTDLRALIHRMADELDHNRQCLLDDRRVTHPLADKARAALAEPKSIEDRIAEADAAIEASIKRVRRIASMPAREIAAEFRASAALAEPEPEGPTDEELMALAVEVFENPCATDKDYARAVLARWAAELEGAQ